MHASTPFNCFGRLRIALSSVAALLLHLGFQLWLNISLCVVGRRSQHSRIAICGALANMSNHDGWIYSHKYGRYYRQELVNGNSSTRVYFGVLLTLSRRLGRDLGRPSVRSLKVHRRIPSVSNLGQECHSSAAGPSPIVKA